jgi:hypothetical protein
MDTSAKHPKVESVLSVLRRRQRRLNVLRWALQGLLAGAIAACLSAPIVWGALGGETVRLALVALSCVVAGGVVGAVVGCFLPISDLRLARAMDRAASGEDRFASALQLLGHRHQERAALVVEDALAHVQGTSPAAALPVKMPRNVRWLPVPLVAVAAFMLLAPQSRLEATAPSDAEISAEEWAAIQQEFAEDLAQLSRAQTPEEEELQKKLEELAAKLGEKPDKKDALLDIARLSEKLDQQRRALGARSVSMKNAAKAMTNSKSLKSFASKLKEGAYDKAAAELRNVSKEMKDGAKSLDGSELESIAADLQKLAERIAEEEELANECENGANAAASMNKEALAEALKRLAEQMEKNAQRMSKRDRMADRAKLLEALKRRMNQKGECQACDGEGCEQCEGNGFGKKPGNGRGKNGGGKGGLKAGWGTAAKWNGGDLEKKDAGTTPELADTFERPGMSTTLPIVSPDERAKSGLKYEELYAEFVQKAEADLDLESVPVAYREFLRRYFNSIKPAEAAPASDDDAKQDP